MPIVGKSIPHDSAVGHVTGQARYVADMRRMQDELIVEFLGSPVASGKLLSIDATEALKLPGIIAVYTAKDIPGHNVFGPIVADEPFLADGSVHYLGQPICVIAGDNLDAVRAAKKLIKLDVQKEEPILSLEAAIENRSFIGPHRVIARGDFQGGFLASEHHLNGVFVNGGQEQFYLESQACLAYPTEEGQVRVLSSTQNPTEIQAVIAEVLGLGMHQVVCECKRMGGGFGGKETQSSIPAIMAAMVALKTDRPARVVYTKDDDMMVTGKRHPYKSFYKVGFDHDGRIQALRYEFFSDGGAFLDLSGGILERTQLHAENAYFIPDIEINAQVCRTNLPPNTAFRGFGGPQGMAAMEHIIEEIAQHLGKDALEVRRVNCYGIDDKNVTPYGQILQENMLPAILDQLEQSSDYQARRRSVSEFNRKSKTHLKGLALTPIKFGISFTASFLNQGNALVNVYTDGTIQVSTGATEMGQGVNTKIRQLVADEFDIPVESVILMSTSTEKNHNTSPTAASASTDLNGGAALVACSKIKERMEEFAAKHFLDMDSGIEFSPASIQFRDGLILDERASDRLSMPFGEFCDLARKNRVNLGERGFYRTPGVGFNRETGKGNPFFYFTCGAGVAEVIIDRFTGDLKVERVDLLVDVGNRINPGVDRGQIIGGFVQGMGWVTAEKLTWNEEGKLLSHSPTTYKIPAINDVPKVFNLDFIDNPNHQKNVAKSKAVGEPPVMLSLCVFSAVKNALSYLGNGKTTDLTLPATGEEILRVITEMETSNIMASS